MTFRKSILLLISLSMLAALVACSSSSTPPPVRITVTLSSVATSLTVNSQTPITATTNDTAGVTWTVTCTTSPCGTLNPTSTLTGAATTYTAPASPTTGVVITATSVTNHAISASTPTITIVAITVTLSNVSTPLNVNSQTPITATTNDTAGVTWTVTCTTSPCGTLNPTSTLTGAATTYTAPAFPTTGVVITATSVTNHAISASTPTITIAAATLADGTYVFSVTGWDYSDESAYHVGGSFTISGGLITQGEQDFVDFNEQLGDEINGTVNGTGLSTVTTTADGNLQITLVTCLVADCTQTDTLVGVSGTETFNGSVYPLNSAKAAITEYDASATGSGELDTQDSTAFVVGTAPGPASYAFVIGGLDGYDAGNGGYAFNMGGVINVDGAAGTGTISGTGSVFDANDGFSGLTYQDEDFASTSIVSAPDAFGRVTFTLDTSVFSEMILAGYIVNSKKIQLVETVDTYEASLGGIAYTQTAPAGGFTSTTASGNSYVVGLNGYDTIFVLQVAGLLTLNADTTISGFINYNDFNLPPQAAPSAITGGNWAEDVGTGRVTLSNVTDGHAGPFTLQLYLDGNNHAPTIMLVDSAAVGGPGFQQSGGGSFAATSFTGPYAMGATGWDFNEDGEFDAVGPVVATGSAGTFAGFSDVNWLSIFSTPPATITVPDENVSGSFTAAANGAFTGTITGLDVTNCPAFIGGVGCTADTFIYYLVDPTGDNIAIETDSNQITLGYFVQQ